MADAMWYIGIGGEQKGPFPEDEIEAMIARRELTARNYVWKEGMASWDPVGEVEAFAEALKEVPPPPAAPIPGAELAKSFWSDLVAIVRDPDEGLIAVASRKPLCFAIAWIVLGVITFALLSLHQPAVPFIQVNGAGGWAVFGKALLHALVLYGISFAALMIAFGPVLKSPADWIDGLVLLGLASIPTATLGLLLFALLWIPSSLVGAFALTVALAVAAPAKVLIIYRVFRHVTQASPRAAMFAVPAIYLGANLAYGILRLGM